MSAANFQVGDRVVLIPFQHKNKVATVRYCGPIGKKFGTWVGLELDEATGDCNGLENNGEKVFECEENFGLILRNTQVRPYDPNAPVAVRQIIGQPTAAPSKLMVGDDILAQLDEKKISTGLSGSPLLTPQASFIALSLQESQAALLEKVNKALPLATTTETNEESAADSKSKIKGWKERLKKIEERKAEEKTKKETPTGMDLDGEADEQLSKQFGLTSGLNKDQNGNLIVAREDVKDRSRLGEDILKRMQEKEQQAQIETKSPSLTNAGSPGKPGHNRMVSNADKIKEKQAKLEEERKLRQGLTGIAKTTAGSRNAGVAGQKSLNQTLTKEVPADKKVGGATPSRTGLNSTLRSTQRDSTAPGDKPPGGLSRAGSSSRLGLQANGERPALSRAGSSSRLGLAAPGTRTGSSTRGAIRGVARGEEKTPVKDMNSTLTRGLASRAGGKTPMPQRPGGPETALKGIRRAVLPKDASKMTPLDYKKLEAQILDKSAEIISLQQEVQSLSMQISQLDEQHKTEIENLTFQKQNEVRALTDRHADEKIQFQTELESITERIMHASPDSSGQNHEIMEMATQQLTQIREEQQNRLKNESESFAKVQLEMQDMKALMSEKNMQILKLQEQVQVMTNQIYEQDKQHQNEIQNLNDRIELLNAGKEVDDFKKTQVEIQEAQTALQASIEASLEARIAEIQKQTEKEKVLVNKEIQKEIQARDFQIKELTRRLSDQATAFTDLEVRRLEESELFQLELEQLKDEKEEVLRQLMEHGKVDEEDPLKDVSIEEIKIQNKKLRIAITSLTFGFEEERRKLEAALQDETSKDREILELKDRIKEMDFLLEEVELKEQERAKMQEAYEEIAEYENMVEEMVQEIAKKEEENEELREQLTEVELEKNLMEDLTAQMEVYNKELTTEITDKDQKITEYKNEIEQLEIIVVEQEELADKYKERLTELQNQIKVLSDQLQDYTQDGSKDQVSLLIEKQQILIGQLRESESKQLVVQKNFIELWQGRTYTDLVFQILPAGLQKEAHLDAYSKVQQLNNLRHKATLFFREVCEKQIELAPQLFEEADHLNLYVQLLVKLGLMMAQVISQCSTIQFQIANSSPEQYRDICNILVWDQIPHLLGILDTILEQLFGQSLSYSYETEDIFVELKTLELLMTKTEKIFVSLSPEEQAAQLKDGTAPDKIIQSIPYQRRQNLASQCSKLKLRNQSITMALGVSLVSYYSTNQEDWRTVQSKCKLIYLRLLDTIMKIDHIPNDDDGGDFIDVKQLNTELRLSQKFEFVQALWVGTESDLELAREKSWLSVLEAVERDITTLNNDFKFKRLIKIVDQKYGTSKIDFNDLYTLDFQAAGPWRHIAKSIQAELQDMTTLKQKNTLLQEKQKEQMLQVLTLKKEQQRQLLVANQLDSKLSQALAKAEQVPALEIERKDLHLAVGFNKKQFEASKDELEKSQRVVADLKMKLEEAKKAAAAAPVPSEQVQVQQSQPNAGRPNIRARYMANKHSSRQSRTNNYYDTLRNTGGFSKQDPNAGHNRNFSQVNNDKIMQQMNMQEDVYMQIICELQYDRLRLKAKDMTKRIAALNQDGSSFSSLLKQFGRQDIKLNSEEQTVVQAAIKEVAGLKSAYKKQMARARVFDLKKPPNAQKEETIERLNQQVSRAKESVNETINLLMSKDTKLIMTSKHNTSQDGRLQMEVIRTKGAEQNKDTVQEILASAEGVSASEIKIGEIKLRGKIQLPARKVILDSSSMSELRRSLAIFSC